MSPNPDPQYVALYCTLLDATRVCSDSIFRRYRLNAHNCTTLGTILGQFWDKKKPGNPGLMTPPRISFAQGQAATQHGSIVCRTSTQQTTTTLC